MTLVTMRPPAPEATRPPAAWVAELLAPWGPGPILVLDDSDGALARGLMRSGWDVAVATRTEASRWWHQAWLDAAATPGLELVARWGRVRPEPELHRRFGAWTHVHFTAEETTWLGIWHQHLLVEERGPERAAGVAAVFATMRYWLGYDRRELGDKPQVPLAVFRHYAGLFPRARRELAGTFRGAANMAPERALSEFPSELVYCYVPPPGGIGMLSSASNLWEQWTRGLPRPQGPLTQPGTGDPEEAADPGLTTVLEAAQVRLLALGYGGDRGERLAHLVTGVGRTILAHEELQVPYPGPMGTEWVTVGLLIAGPRGLADEGMRT